MDVSNAPLPTATSDPTDNHVSGYGRLRSVFASLARARTFGVAAEMSFFLFTSLIPLAAIFGLVTAKLAIDGGAAATILYQATPAEARTFLRDEFRNVAAWNGGAVAPLSAIVFLWMASSGVHAIFDGIEVQAGSSLPWWKKRGYALLSCFVLSVGVAAIAALLTGAETVATWAHVSLPHGASASERVVARIVQFVVGGTLAVAMVAALYRLAVPSSSRHRTLILPGAVFAVSAHVLLGVGYGLVVRMTGTGGAYQAGLALVGVTLTSLYLSSVALLLGAEINRALAARRPGSPARGLG